MAKIPIDHAQYDDNADNGNPGRQPDLKSEWVNNCVEGINGHRMPLDKDISLDNQGGAVHTHPVAMQGQGSVGDAHVSFFLSQQLDKAFKRLGHPEVQSQT